MLGNRIAKVSHVGKTGFDDLNAQMLARDLGPHVCQLSRGYKVVRIAFPIWQKDSCLVEKR